MISYSKTLRISALLCAITTTGFAVGQDGVYRMSDRSTSSSVQNNTEAPGIIRVSGGYPQAIQQARYETGGCTQSCTSGPACAAPGVCGKSCSANGQCGGTGCKCGCNAGYGCSCNSGAACGNGCNSCHGNVCYSPMDCNSVFASGYGPGACCNGVCGVNGCNGQNDVTVFAGSVDSGTGSACRDFYRGQSMSFRNKNARLADKLFGWMIPSGCCGRGCPPAGKYQITYANQPDYINPNDTQLYGAQGYGMPMTVPLAPNVNYSYNYSSGIPASRLTQIGNYNPQTSPQPLYHQTW